MTRPRNALACLTVVALTAPAASPAFADEDPATLRMSISAGDLSLRPGQSTTLTVRVLAGRGTLEGATLSLSATKPGVLSSSCAGGCGLGTVGTGGASVSATVTVPSWVGKATSVAFTATADAANAPGQTRGVVISVRPKVTPSPKPTPKPRPTTPKPSPSPERPKDDDDNDSPSGQASPSNGAQVEPPSPNSSLQAFSPAGPTDVNLPQIAAPPTVVGPLSSTTVPLPPSALRSGRSLTGLPAPVLGAHAAWLSGLFLSTTFVLIRRRRWTQSR